MRSIYEYFETQERLEDIAQMVADFSLEPYWRKIKQ